MLLCVTWPLRVSRKAQVGLAGGVQGAWPRALGEGTAAPSPRCFLPTPQPCRLRGWAAQGPPGGLSPPAHGIPAQLSWATTPGPELYKTGPQCTWAAPCWCPTQPGLPSGDGRGETPGATLRPTRQWSPLPPRPPNCTDQAALHVGGLGGGVGQGTWGFQVPARYGALGCG